MLHICSHIYLLIPSCLFLTHYHYSSFQRSIRENPLSQLFHYYLTKTEQYPLSDFSTPAIAPTIFLRLFSLYVFHFPSYVDFFPL